MKRIITFLLLITATANTLFAQSCPANPTYKNQSGTYTLGDNVSIVLDKAEVFNINVQGTFAATASICATNGAKVNLTFSSVNTIKPKGSIYVDQTSSLTLTGSGFTGFPLTLINEGDVIQSANVVFIDGAIINNSGTYTMSGKSYFNSGTISINNKGYLKFTSDVYFNSSSLVIDNKPNGDIDCGIANMVLSKTSLINAGAIRFGGDVTLQSSSAITNYGYISLNSRTNAGFVMEDATITNKGVIESTGKIVINSGSTLINNCTVVGKSDIANNGTIYNTSDILITKSAFTNQGVYNCTSGSLLQGANFTNNKTVNGGGKFYFTGTTTNSSTFAGTNGQYLTFHDATNLLSSKIFDVQNTNPSNTNKNVVVPNVATTFTTCTSIEAPEITKQPASANLCTVANTSATFSVTANSYNAVAYQWYVNGKAIAGATASSYTATGLTLADTANAYTVEVSNDAGAVTSNPASINYIILAQPAPASLYLATGSSATFSIKTSNATAWKWQKANVAIAGATEPSYTNSAIALSDAGSYNVLVSYNGGTCTSNSAALTVENLPVITRQPVTTALCDNATTSTKLSTDATSASSLTFQWYKNGVAITGATSKDLSLNNLTLADTANTYYAIATNGVGTTKTNTASIKYLIVSQPAPASVNLATGAPLSFAIKASSGASIQWLLENVSISGATAATYAKAAAALTDAGKYKATVTYNGVACVTKEAIATVENLPVITRQPVTTALCDNATTSTKLSTDATSASSLTFQWYKNGVAITGATSKDLSLNNLTMADTANTYYAIATNGVGTTKTNTASIKYLIVSQPAPASVNLATGAPLSFAIKASSGASIQWLLENVSISGATAATYAKAAAALTDAGKYKATVTYNGVACVTNEAIATVENLPVITRQPVTTALCDNATTSTKLSTDATSASSLTFQWYKNGVAITGATSKDLSLNNLTLADTANAYYAIATNGVGTTKTNTASIKYLIVSQPAPAALTVVTGSPASFSIKTTANSTIQWLFENNNILLANAATYSKDIALPADAGKYKAIVTGAGVSCTTSEAILTVQNPLAQIVVQPATQMFCSPATNASATFSVSATSPSAMTYQWYKKDAAIAGATGTTFTATGLTMADTSVPFRVTITNAAGKVTSADAFVKYVMVGQPTPATQLLATGNDASFSLKTSGATSIVWRKEGINLPGATNLNLVLSAVNTTDAGKYTALVTYPGGVCTSEPAILNTSTVLYLKKDGDLNETKNWGVNLDGTGSMPVNFLRPEHTFVVANRATAKTGGTLTIAGTLDLANANVTIEDGRSLTVGRIIRSQPNGVLSATLKDSLFIQGTAGGASDLYFDKVYNTIQRLTINGSAVTLRTRLNIANNNGDKPNNNGVLTVNAGTFYTSDSLTLKSDKYGTGSIARSLGTIVGKITVEKYINNKRSWRLMGAPVSASDAQTINAAYQEGAKSSTDNPHPGYGTHITYGAVTNGFDQNPQKSFSMKVYNSATGLWTGVPATNQTKVTDYPAYMLFIRGNRSYPITSTTSKTPASSTVLRVTGSAVQGTQPAKTVAAQGTTLVVNPYACPVNFKQIKAAGTNLKARIRMWDPTLAGTNGTGGWVTVDGTGGIYRATPPSDLTTIIQAGQGFFVESADGVNQGSLILSEDSKDLTGKTTSGDREAEENYTDTSLEINLRILDTATAGYAITDGVLYHFDAANNDAIDGNDALKISNFSENLSIVEYNSLLTISSRKLPLEGDTLKLSLTGMKQTSYQLEFVPAGLSGKTFMLYDKYLDQYTALSATDTTRVTFSISATAASKVASRFSLVLQPQAPPRVVLPVSITKVKAYAKEKVAVVEWSVAGEKNIARYEVETSANGSLFTLAGTVSATGVTSYSFTHTTPVKGVNYYRVKSVENDGSYHYTGVVTAVIEEGSASSSNTVAAVSVYPNPLTGTRFTLTLSHLAAGSYHIAIRSTEGKAVYSTQLTHGGGTQSQTVTLPRTLAAGMYYLTATAADGTQTTTKIAATN